MPRTTKSSTDTKTARKDVEKSAEEISDDLKALREDVDSLIAHIGSYAKSETKAGVESVKETGDVALREGERVVEQSRDYIKQNPLIACAAALGAGFIAATITRR
jgi:ElaB/YqjD/DUF883 family membrane-anchored ribosome-binding protein|tara:strand:- start:52 stop:366 length:315 start_codon:yes stop_codon:yes gene_type:complete